MTTLVTGGAGYIGSHAVKYLQAAGHSVVVVDNLDRGHRQAIPPNVPLKILDLRQTEELLKVLLDHKIDAVIHFAALAYIGESVENPLRYYDNNTAGTLSLLRAMERASVSRLVFSSTCATYGQPDEIPINEQTPQFPINPYGWSKLFAEQMLRDYTAQNETFAFVTLRYFNVTGCAADGSLGEDHDPETHLVPLLLRSALGRGPRFTIHGDDYDTPDGTCIRDYIHVDDLVAAHIMAMDALNDGDQRAYNLGIGRAYSVRDVIESTQRVTGIDVPVQIGPRRPGDPSQLCANPEKAQRELGWSAQLTDLDAIIETAWKWFRRYPDGYGRKAR